MKYLLVLLVVVVGLWLLLRQRGGDPPAPTQPGPRRGDAKRPDEIVACAHCDLRVPRAEALTGADGQPYCSEAHRLAGPG